MSRTFGVASKPSTAARYTFTLNVDFAQLDASLGCIPAAKSFGVVLPKNSSKIQDIFPGATSTFSFLDPEKKTKRWTLTMKDAMKDTVLPAILTSEVKCWWCHDLFRDAPIGCPIKYVKDIRERVYYSHANKKDIRVLDTGGIGGTGGTGGRVNESTEDSYFLTKGYLCCWECLLAYAESVKTIVETRESVQLVYQMYEAATGNPGNLLIPAPHYTLKKEYGGPLSPEEYKSKHETYQPTGNSYIRMVPFGELFKTNSGF